MISPALETINSKKIAKELLTSAIEFFEISIKYAQQQPRISIANFAIALELSLKAMVALHHWGLLVEKFKDTTLDEFKNGTVSTIKATEAIKVINSLYTEKIEGKEFEAYQKVFKLRNRIMHFYHNELSDSTDADESIITEFFAWDSLSKRLSVWNRTYLKDLRIGLLPLTRKMAKLEKFTELMYNKVKNEVVAAEKQGLCVFECSICKKNAQVETELFYNHHLFQIVSSQCKVCARSALWLVTKCPKCQSRKQLKEQLSYSSFVCSDCPCDFTTQITLFNKNKDNKEKIYCPDCASDQVIKDDELFVCLQCSAHSYRTEQCLSCGASYFGEEGQFTQDNNRCSMCAEA